MRARTRVPKAGVLHRRNAVLIGCAALVCCCVLFHVSLARRQIWDATSISPFPPPLPPGFDDSDAWCQHLRDTPEPPLVVYNRIPKAGGMTLRVVYKRIKKVGGVLTPKAYRVKPRPHVILGPDYWGLTNRNNLTGKLLSKFHSILEESDEGTTTIVDGHSRPMFPVPNATFMNMMRLPKSRTVSSFYYRLYDSIAAKKSDDGIDPKLLEEVESPLLDDKCLNSNKCLKRLSELCRVQSNFLCTRDSCGEEQPDGSYAKIDIGKILSNKNLEVLGFLEEFEKSLDMFECAFPSIFEDAKPKLAKMAPVNVGTRKFGIASKKLEKLMDENFCREETELYRRALEQFNYRYDRMMASRGSCCRVSRN